MVDSTLAIKKSTPSIGLTVLKVTGKKCFQSSVNNTCMCIIKLSVRVLGFSG